MALFKLTKQDRDYYALQELLKPKEDQQEERAGIGTKPSKQEQDEEGRFSSFFGGLFDRSKQQAEELSKLAQEEAERSALEARLMREARGITKSLTQEDVSVRSAVGDPVYGNQMPEDIMAVEATDVSEETDDETIKTGGIMSKPDADGVQPTVGKETEGMGFLNFISKGEGGYESSNRGTKGQEIQGSTHSTLRDGKKLSEMTIDEIRAKQKIEDPDNAERLFAVGKYQLIPDTFEMAVKATGLSGDTIFNADTQEKLGQYLLFEKRPALGAYIRGESNDMPKALLEAAKEWASLPVPSGSKKGKSYHGKGNKAQHTVEETIKALNAARTSYMESIGAGPTESIRPRLRGS